MNNVDEKTDLKSVKVLSAGHMVNDSYGGFIFPILPVLAAHLGLSLSLVGLMTAIAGISSSFLQPVFGYISDRVERRFFIFWGLMLSCIFISLLGYANNYLLLVVLLSLGNMGVALYHPQATALAGYFSGKEINKHMGLFTACGTIGYATGPILSSALVGFFGLKSTIWAIFPGLIMTYLIYKMVPKISKKTNTSTRKSWYIDLFQFDKIVYNLAFVSITRAISIISFTILMPFMLKGYGINIINDISSLFSVIGLNLNNTTITGILLSLFSLLGGIGSYYGGKLSNIYGKRTVMLFSLLPAMPCLLGTLYFMQIIPLLSVFLFVMSGFFLMSSSSINIVIAQKAAPKDIAMVSGLIGGFCWGIAHLSQYPITLFSQIYGIVPVLTIISFIPLLGALSTAFISKEYE